MSDFVGYLRVSTKSQRIDGLGMSSQERLVGDYVTRQGGTLVGMFREVESGAKTDQERPALSEALLLAKKMKATVIVAKLDRLSRNAEFLLRLQNSNVSFVCCDCPNVDRFTVGILALVAQRERELISERTAAALQAAKRRGKVLGTRQPQIQVSRMVKANRSKKMEFVKKISPLIEEIRSSGIFTLREIANCLNKRGERTRRGQAWNQTAVKRVLDLVA
jgi:DNA invertase Pin-like site-specific DNA recombinase